MRVLFICSRNIWRSKTAEDMYKLTPGLDVRSAGTSPFARIHVKASDILWADVIIVMEKKHKEILEQRFGARMTGKDVKVLHIPDKYHYMHPLLVEILRQKLDEYFEERSARGN